MSAGLAPNPGRAELLSPQAVEDGDTNLRVMPLPGDFALPHNRFHCRFPRSL
jgi:hypothetical protein